LPIFIRWPVGFRIRRWRIDSQLKLHFVERVLEAFEGRAGQAKLLAQTVHLFFVGMQECFD
jgi:hypothetical protein